MMKRQGPKSKSWIRYYDDPDILDEITGEPLDLVLEERLGEDKLVSLRLVSLF